MKKLFLLILCLVLTGCSKIDIQVNWNYGVHYDVKNEADFEKQGLLTIYLDPDHPDVIASLFVTPGYEYYAIDPETEEKLESENSTNHRNQRYEKTVYDYMEFLSPENTPQSMEWIRINFYMDELDLKEHPLLIEHLGLEKELEDGILYYKEELLKSETFKYKWLIEKGEFKNNISFVQDPKYDYPDYEKSKKK